MMFPMGDVKVVPLANGSIKLIQVRGPNQGEETIISMMANGELAMTKIAPPWQPAPWPARFARFCWQMRSDGDD